MKAEKYCTFAPDCAALQACAVLAATTESIQSQQASLTPLAYWAAFV